MAMEVILREDVEKLGSRGDLVKVAPGYARNFLLPKKMAVAATDGNRKIVEQISARHVGRFLKGGQTQTASLAVLAHEPARGEPRAI